MLDLSALHFLRPAWLLLVPACALLAWAAGQRHRVERQWRGRIAEHLLPHLVVRAPRALTPGPRAWFVVLGVLAALALAGPAWQREPPPFADDRGVLVIAVDLAPGMNAIDTQPTRLARARQKVGELLARRQGAKTVLIAFAGTAHRVLPATDDAQLVTTYLSALESTVMPRAGGASTRLAQVMALAHEQLAREAAGTAGTVLVVSDGHDLALPATVAAPPTLLWLFGDGAAAPLAVDSRGAASGLRAGSVPARDEAALDALLAQHDMARIDARVDDGDVDAVNRRIEQQLAQAAETRADRAWRDDGVLLLWPLLALAALGFRRGWGLRW